MQFRLKLFRAVLRVLADLVVELPGYDGATPSKHYSGYIRTGETRGVPGSLHYWLIESEGDPMTDVRECCARFHAFRPPLSLARADGRARRVPRSRS